MPFTLEELEAAVKEMKNNTAPGPDGYSTLLWWERQRIETGNFALGGTWELWRAQSGDSFS